MRGPGAPASRYLLDAFALLLALLVLSTSSGPLQAQDLDDLDGLGDEADEDDDFEPEDDADDDDGSADSDDGADREEGGEADLEEDLDDTDLPVDEDADDMDADEDTSGRALSVRFGGGLGAGTFAFERDRGLIRDVLHTTGMMVAEALVALHFWPRESLSLLTELEYQTSVGFQMSLQPQFALPLGRVDARFQRTQLRLAPVLRLGEGTLSLALPVGFALKTLTFEEDQYTLRGFVLGGATLGVDVHLRLGDWGTLRLGPAVEWLFILGSELPDDGVCCQGLGLGGHASLDLRVTRVLQASLAYQETHTGVPMFGDEFESVVRMVTARLLGEM